MGIWNETCMLSHLPILEGEAVGGVLLAQNKDSKRTSYPDEIWKPISPVIRGEYDGYGRIAGLKDWSSLETCYRTLGKIGQLAFLAEGREIPAELLNLKTLIKYAEHDALLVRYKTALGDSRRRVALAMIRFDILQYVYAVKSSCFQKFVRLCDQGLPIEDPGTGRPVHSILKWLHENKVCVADARITDKRAIDLINALIDHMVNEAGGHAREVIGVLLDVGFTSDELVNEFLFTRSDVEDCLEEDGEESDEG